MGGDFFEYLPSEIVVNILSRLPTQAIMACKCVCKPWFVLLATPEFVNSHISTSVPGIIVRTHLKSYGVIEFVDELGLNFDEKHRWNVAFSFKLPFLKPMISSANGLIFLGGIHYYDLVLCNPITRDYIRLPRSQRNTPKYQIDMMTFGFGVSRMTGQYKVVGIFFKSPLPKECKIECQVYTVGTGSWRNVPFGSPLRLRDDIGGVHLNGNLHWMTEESREGLGGWISCFDLETELFSTFSAPPPLDISVHLERKLSVLRDCLCTSDNSLDGCVIIWLMNDDDKCWTKEFVIPQVGGVDDFGCVWPIRVFENGDALMKWEDMKLYYYNKTKNLDYDITPQVDFYRFSPPTIYASSFLSLKSFVMENVSSF